MSADMEVSGVLPSSATLAARGVRSSTDFRNLMSALMTDVITGAIDTDTANAACNAGGKLLKMVELEFKYAAASSAGRNQSLEIASKSGSEPSV